ncbi:hypothetical protein [Dechloromonas sp.]|uniref:hypothetical protein n=1 Tax=Dechloromonas sp. TaxID=1917218 RepID=UPI00286DC63E|nr:hypothetical protein [Dechloromonas sp.]
MNCNLVNGYLPNGIERLQRGMFMAISPGHQPIEPDTPNPKDPIHHPHKPDHPFHDEREEEGIETDDDEDTGANPWWM